MSQPTIDTLAALLRYCEHFAKRMLAEAGELHPFGAFINRNGEVEALAGHLGSEHARGTDLYALLEGAVDAMAADGKAVAYALAANVNVPSRLSSPFPDGVRVHVEAPGYSRLIYTPYRILSYPALRRFLAVLPTVEYAEPITEDVPNTVFKRAEA